MDCNFLRQFRSARQCSVPLVAVKTSDPAATISAVVVQETKNGDSPISCLTWDCVRGFTALDQNSRTALATMLGQRPPESVLAFADALKVSAGMPDRGILFCLNADGQLDLRACQAVWNLRDCFPGKGCTLVLLGPDFSLPARISGDILILEEPLPDSGEIRNIITSVYSDAKKQVVSLPSLTEDSITQAVKACSGLASFPINQSVAMSISKTGLDVDSLWKRKKDQIEQTPGLSIWSGNNQFSNVKDCDNVIGFLKNYLPNVSVIVFLDEIGDAFAGVAGDSSGVSQKMHGALLTYMEDHDVNGMLFLGHPGTGKSEVAKCCSESGKRLVISMDVAKMESRYVGDSTNHLHSALKVVSAVGQNQALFIGTCNSVENLTPQMRRRFKLGTFYFDVPSKIGREQLWKHYSNLYTAASNHETNMLQVTKQIGLCGFDDTGWTGAEIRTCCKLSRDLRISLNDAAQYIVPITRSSAEKIESLNRSADGRFISASYSGPYQMNRPEPSKQSRKFNSMEN